MNRKIILISGRAYSGKDTLANYLVEKYGYVKFTFADELKKHTSTKYKIPFNYFYTHEMKDKIYKNNQTYRDFLIKEADFIRKSNDSYFALKIVEEIKKSEATNIVISDFRFKVEYDTLKQFFKDSEIITLQIKRHDNPIINNKSENCLKEFNFDGKFNNCCTLAHLKNYVDINYGYFF